MGNSCRNIFSASRRKLQMLNTHLENYNKRISTQDDTLHVMGQQEAGLIHRIRREALTLKQHHKVLPPSAVAPGSPIYRMAVQLAELKGRIVSANAQVAVDRRNRAAINKLIAAAEQETHVDLASDLEKYGLTLAEVQRTGEEAHLASESINVVANASDIVAPAETMDIGALIAAIVNGGDPVTAIYSPETHEDSVNATLAHANGTDRLVSADDRGNDNDDDTAASVVYSDHTASRSQRVIMELGN